MSPRTAAVLAAVTDAYRRDGAPPTVRAIQAATGISSTSVVSYHLARLARVGALRHRPGQAGAYLPVETAACPPCPHPDCPRRAPSDAITPGSPTVTPPSRP